MKDFDLHLWQGSPLEIDLKIRTIARTAAVFLILLQVPAVFSETCERQKAGFAELNGPLIFRSESDWKRFNQKQFDEQTEGAHQYLREQIIAELDAGRSDPKSIEMFLRCVLSLHEYQSFREETNTPVVYSLGPEPPAIAVAYYIYRGGNAIPDTRPYFEVYQRGQTRHWTWIGEVGERYRRSTFFVHALSPGIPGQSWYLLSGFEVGDNGTRLHLELISFDGETLRSIWTKSGLAQTTLEEAHADYFVLSVYKGFHDGHDVYVREVYDVVPGGLRERPAK